MKYILPSKLATISISNNYLSVSKFFGPIGFKQTMANGISTLTDFYAGGTLTS